MNKQNLLTILLCAALLCGGAAAYFYTPYPVAPQPELLHISMIRRTEQDAESTLTYENITDRIDPDTLIQQLTSCKATRLPVYQSSYTLGDVLYEIDVLYDEQPLHFVLGKDYLVYESAPWYHRLQNAQDLINVLDAMTAAPNANPYT